MKSHRILNLDILSVTSKDLLGSLDQGMLFTPNVDHLIKLQKDRSFYEAYKQADWIICDSKILSLCAKFLGIKFKEVITGASFLSSYYNFHKNNKNVKIFLLGSVDDMAKVAKNKINAKVGREMVVGAHSPSFGFDQNDAECENIIDKINRSGANVLVVGVGAPKQEKWIVKYKDSLPGIKTFMALGAVIDFESGKIKRAPKVFQKMHMEWFYRLMKEPGRLWKRYLIEDMPFFFLIIKQKLGKYCNPFDFVLQRKVKNESYEMEMLIPVNEMEMD